MFNKHVALSRPHSTFNVADRPSYKTIQLAGSGNPSMVQPCVALNRPESCQLHLLLEDMHSVHTGTGRVSPNPKISTKLTTVGRSSFKLFPPSVKLASTSAALQCAAGLTCSCSLAVTERVLYHGKRPAADRRGRTITARPARRHRESFSRRDLQPIGVAGHQRRSRGSKGDQPQAAVCMHDNAIV